MMNGRVYLWTPDPKKDLGGSLSITVVPLLHLDEEEEGTGRLWGRHARVKNGGEVNVPDPEADGAKAIPIGDAAPDTDGNFIFEQGRGGGRMDKVVLAEPDFRWRYIQASHFGEVNTYFHLDRIASYVDALLHELGASPLPKVVAVVNAHHAATEKNGVRDGFRGVGHWHVFQGAHYRLPSDRATQKIKELHPVSSDGEIHLGPGWQLLNYGALVEAAGGRYRTNASHNPGILYHEFGHHIARHTADFRANALLPREQQDNRKTALDEGFADYWAATMMDTPHIWACHHRHDARTVHRRSLVSKKTMADFVPGSKADPHENGTIWAATLWDLRSALARLEADGKRRSDLMVLLSLLLLGRRMGAEQPPTIKSLRRARKSFSIALAALLEADRALYAGRYHDLILSIFVTRGIKIKKPVKKRPAVIFEDNGEAVPRQILSLPFVKCTAVEDIPPTKDLFTATDLQAYLDARGEPSFSVMVVGDIMLHGRARKIYAQYGSEYPFEAVAPLLKKAQVVVGNLEGPIARKAKKQERNFSYRARPDSALSIAAAGIRVLTLANNHLVDCGREGVLETLDAVKAAGIAAIGAGVNKSAAHEPFIVIVGKLRIGILGYYWNRRCAATKDLPGSAMDTPEELKADIGRLRKSVDRIIVTSHWGIPYDREPLPDDRVKARLAIDFGADAVVSHHVHVIHPFEVYRNRPIFYSIGNFAFGSGNSRGEGLMVGLRFEENQTSVAVFPIYVKNRDPRVNYQPKILRGDSSRRVLDRLAKMSEKSGALLSIDHDHGRIELPYSPLGDESA